MGRGGGGLIEKWGLINLLRLKRGAGDVLEGGSLFERGSLIESLRYICYICGWFPQ